MPTPKHTPGPWYIVARSYSNADRQHLEIATFDRDGMPAQCIATVRDCIIEPGADPDTHAPEVHANARLIASAPALVEALREIQNADESRDSIRLNRAIYLSREVLRSVGEEA